VGKSVVLYGAPDCHGNSGEFVGGEVNCRHGPDIIGRHLSSKEKVNAGSLHCSQTPATEQKVNKIGKRIPLLTLVGVFCSPKSTGNCPGRLKFELPSFKSDS
jgi:hypothetical protein